MTLWSVKCESSRRCITDSATFDNVGNKLIGRQLFLSDFTLDRLYIQQMWAILKISGKIPALNMLLNIWVNGKDKGVAILEINLPGIPQCDE